MVVDQVDSPYLHVIRSYFENWEVNEAPMGLSDLPDLETAKVLMFDTLPPEWVAERMWKIPSVETIVCGNGLNIKVPLHWTARRGEVSHAHQGGTSNVKYSAWIFEKEGEEATQLGELHAKPSQDLRSVMKVAKPGRKVWGPAIVPPKETGTAVAELRTGTVGCWGLYPLNRTSPRHKVRTVYGGDLWVDRHLTPMEEATVRDVPERLSKSLDGATLVRFVRSGPGPVKCLQGLLEMLRLPSSNENSGEVEAAGIKRTCEVMELEESMPRAGKRSRPGEVKIQAKIASVVVETVDEEDDSEEMPDADRDLKAAKNDNAAVPIEMWNKYTREGAASVDAKISDAAFGKAADVIRVQLLCWWKRSVTRSFLKWVRDRKKKGDSPTNEAMEAGRDAVARAAAATVWGWPEGSTPFFWRWPAEYESIIMSGLKLWIMDKLEPWTQAQKLPKDAKNKEKVLEKLADIRRKGYVEAGKVESLISFFEVPKGESDIRMVYDGTKSGLNDALWAPWFPLPTVETMLRSVTGGTWLGDNDVGEMFLNFMLHEEVRRLCGVDFTLYFPEELSEEHQFLWARWTRCAMGLRTSPYQAVQGMLWAQEMILGKPDQEDNVFRWDAVKLNLPGSEDYDPSEPWVCKVRMDGVLASDIHVYVDDIRTTAHSEEECWKASQRVSSVLAYLGLQDAARKRRPPGQGDAAWAGSVVHTVYGRVTRMVSQEKWDKTKSILDWIWEQVNLGDDIDHKPLESHRGFLIYVSRTYPGMTPYLKGIHATLDSWRPGRDNDGWRVNNRRNHSPGGDEMKDLRHEPKVGGDAYYNWRDKPPKRVRMVGRLRSDMMALRALTDFATPPHRLVRATKSCRVIYGFGDASGTGFGSSIIIGGKLAWKSGQWNVSIKEESSNYRELLNLVLALEELALKGELDGCEIFMFTDNSTAESASFRGTSSSRLLFDLVLRLKKLEMSAKCLIYLVHVAGTRMIWQGTDGLSRGDQNAGVMRGENMLEHVPLDQTCFQRSPKLEPWVRTWLISQNVGAEPVFLKPDDWPCPHPSQGVYVWSPPPAAASAAVEWMAQSIHKRPSSTHVVFIPRLMSAWWMRMLRKATDVSFVIPVGTPVWGKDMHEPLILAVYFPLRKNAPWRIRGTEEAERLERSVREVWKDDFGGAGPLLCKFLGDSRRLAAVPQHLL